MPPALCGGFNLVLAYVGRAQDSHCDILIGTGIFSKKIGWLKCAFHGVSLVLKYFYLVDWTDVLPVLRYYYLVDLLSVLNFVCIVWLLMSYFLNFIDFETLLIFYKIVIELFPVSLSYRS